MHTCWSDWILCRSDDCWALSATMADSRSSKVWTSEQTRWESNSNYWNAFIKGTIFVLAIVPTKGTIFILAIVPIKRTLDTCWAEVSCAIRPSFSSSAWENTNKPDLIDIDTNLQFSPKETNQWGYRGVRIVMDTFNNQSHHDSQTVSRMR